jgi:hypothetical protein
MKPVQIGELVSIIRGDLEGTALSRAVLASTTR